MTEQIKLHSQIDPSVNNYMDGFETRFVIREDAVIIYLSSFKGCNQACRMCHLTQTGQTDMTPATLEDFVAQAKESFKDAFEYTTSIGMVPGKIHFNFMAKGEPFLNKTVMDNWTALSEALLVEKELVYPEIDTAFKISTIMTGVLEYDKDGIIVGGYTKLPFQVNRPEIYYSLYSMDPEFRKRWLPKAQDPHLMLPILADYVTSGGKVRFHSAIIEGHNSEILDMQPVIQAIKFWGLVGNYNLVRFNTPDATKYVEAGEEERNDIRKYLEDSGFTVQMVDKVGRDIAASCGTFLSTDGSFINIQE